MGIELQRLVKGLVKAWQRADPVAKFEHGFSIALPESYIYLITYLKL